MSEVELILSLTVICYVAFAALDLVRFFLGDDTSDSFHYRMYSLIRKCFHTDESVRWQTKDDFD